VAILTERKVWRARAPYRDPLGLAPEEQANVRRALRALRVRYSNWKNVTRELGIPKKSLERTITGKDRVRADDPGCQIAERGRALRHAGPVTN
jgi:hypothetical protein